MNAAKMWAAAAVLGVSIAAFSCRQDLAPTSTPVEPVKTEAGAERKAAAATYGDGDYTFFFKNGNKASGDCDGYSSAPGGDTTIYEWWKSDIKKWAERLSAAGIRYADFGEEPRFARRVAETSDIRLRFGVSVGVPRKRNEPRVHYAGLADNLRERARVDSVQTDDAVAFQESVYVAFRAEV